MADPETAAAELTADAEKLVSDAAAITVAAPAPAPQANGAGHVEPGTAFAVLTAPRGPLRAAQVVFGPRDAIAAVIAAGEARAADDAEIEISNPFHYPLPPAAASEA